MCVYVCVCVCALSRVLKKTTCDTDRETACYKCDARVMRFPWTVFQPLSSRPAWKTQKKENFRKIHKAICFIFRASVHLPACLWSLFFTRVSVCVCVCICVRECVCVYVWIKIPVQIFRRWSPFLLPPARDASSFLGRRRHIHSNRLFGRDREPDPVFCVPHAPFRTVFAPFPDRRVCVGRRDTRRRTECCCS